MLRPLLAGALLAALAGGAPGCKSNLWSDVSDHVKTKSQQDRDKEPCLGIVVAKDPDPHNPFELGLFVHRVLKASPAEQAGIRPGDELRALGGKSVRSAHDLEAALRAWNPVKDLPVAIVIARDGEEWQGQARLTTWGEQLKLARERTQSHAKTYESKLSIPFLLDYQKLEVKPDLWLDYFGEKIEEPVVLYKDMDVIPLLGIFSLYRWETSSYRDAWRLQLLVWPLKFTRVGEEDETENLAPGEDELQCL